jgi:hypothetical protein
MQKMTFTRVLSTSLGALTIVAVMACNPRIDRAEADRLAKARLEQYSKEESLKIELFAPPRVQDEKGRWLYIYDYSGRPKQSVSIIVSENGRVEFGRLLDDTR